MVKFVYLTKAKGIIMKITIDTDRKEVVCPQVFFERHHELKEMSKITGGKEMTLEEYLDTLYKDCRGNIKNASIYRKKKASTKKDADKK